MFGAVLKKIFGTRNERELKRIRPVVAQIGAFEPALRELTDAALAAKTAEFKELLKKIDHLPTRVCAETERSFLAALATAPQAAAYTWGGKLDELVVAHDDHLLHGLCRSQVN